MLKLVEGLTYEKSPEAIFWKTFKLKSLTSQLLSDIECMSRHRRISDTDESVQATINSLRDALDKKDLEIKNLKREISHATSNNLLKNKELDALHYVWCDGGCKLGAHRYHDEKVTEDLVLIAERNTQRLRRWFENSEFKKRNYQPLPMHKKIIKKIKWVLSYFRK